MINITTDIEQILTQFARAIPDLFLEFDREAIQVVHAENEVFDIVLVLSEDEEEIVGGMVLRADFDLSYEIFED